MEKKTFGGQEYDVYTMADWTRDRVLNVQVGQVIEPDVFWQLCESVPPHKWGRSVFQPGEAYSWDFDNHCQLYQTFEQMGGDYHKYVGLKP